MTPLKPLPLVPIQVRGAAEAIDFLPDSGANFSVISITDYKAAGLPLDDIDPETHMAGDPEMADGLSGGMRILGVTRTVLTLGRNRARVELYVADKVKQPLLSRDATLELEALPPPRSK